jgi:glycosyltransferase involved in cell wall biosynthesis
MSDGAPVGRQLPLRVAIDVRVSPGRSGGIATAVGRLVHALGELSDGPEQYTIVVGSEEQLTWLRPSVGPNQQLVMRPRPRKERLLRPVRPAIRFVQELLTPPRYWPEVPLSDGFYESLGCDVIHFPTQSFTLCGLRSVYNPIDLQHLHHPEFFDSRSLAWRETQARTACQFAQALIVNSNWIRDDVVRQYRIDSGKIHVVPEAPPTSSSIEPSDAALEDVRARYQLSERFLLYPSVTWPHKNHLRLFQALAHLRDQYGLRVPLLCTGSRDDAFWPHVLEGMRELSLDSQVRFLGHVPQDDLRALYRLATALVLPSLFEANSLPIFEAWLEGTPVACSNATALPEQVGDAALLFDPYDPVSMADRIASIVTDPSLGATLRVRGHRRLTEFSWARTAHAYRSIYRHVTGRSLTPEDRRALQEARPSERERAMEARG